MNTRIHPGRFLYTPSDGKAASVARVCIPGTGKQGLISVRDSKSGKLRATNNIAMPEAARFSRETKIAAAAAT
jgi:hypothetical protein